MKSKIKLSQYTAPLIGIDEVGRGCLAGPVVAAAVIFKSKVDTRHYVDSKKINQTERETLSLSIHQHHFVAVGWASVEEIDEINILQASFVAMHRAVDLLFAKISDEERQTSTLLVDGRDKIPSLGHLTQVPVIQGDDRVRVISAASIAAKVARDQFMIELAKTGHDYGFEKHKGYATLHHRQQIRKFGPGIWHRQTFGGVKEYLEQPSASAEPDFGAEI